MYYTFDIEAPFIGLYSKRPYNKCLEFSECLNIVFESALSCILEVSTILMSFFSNTSHPYNQRIY